MRVALLTHGSRGDTEPYVALARGFQAMGHTACLFTNLDLVPFSESHGVAAVPVFPPCRELIDKAGGIDGSNFKAVSASAVQWVAENPGKLEDCAEAVARHGAELVLFSVLAAKEASRSCAASGGIPAVMACFQPGAAEFVSREKRPGQMECLCGVSPLVVPEAATVVDMRCTGYWCFTAPTAVAGGPQAAPSVGSQALQSFLAAADDLPVYIGWGSIRPPSLSEEELLLLALNALRLVGARGVVVGGWAKLEEAYGVLRHDPEGYRQKVKEQRRLRQMPHGERPCAGETADRREGDGLGDVPREAGSPDAEHAGSGQRGECLDTLDMGAVLRYAEERVHVTSEAPHGWLFPRCSCIVHHGGAGTTGQAMRSGRPMVITPILLDQFYWAPQVEKLRVGRGLAALDSLRAADLADAIRGVLDDKELQRAAAELGELLRAEDGVKLAVGICDAVVTEEKVKQLFRDYDAGGRGIVSKAMLTKVLVTHGMPKAKVGLLLDAADGTTDEGVNYSEFIHWLFRSFSVAA